MSILKVVISGAGIAGPVAAYFLAQANAEVTVIERAPAPRRGGQNVDIRGHGLTVLQRMGVEDAIRAKTTEEKGLRFVDADNRSWADFPVDDGKGFTSDIEIMRGDLANILYEHSKGHVTYRFGDSVRSFSEDDEGIDIQLESGKTIHADVLIAADGWNSATRKLAFGSDISQSSVNDLGQWTAWFTIPPSPSDSYWARWYNAPGKRMVLIRPDAGRSSRVSLWVMPKDDKLDHLVKADMAEQKAHWLRLFQNAGWETDRVLKALPQADDFYMQKVAQVKLPSWSQGRVVVAGDAGYCPSPISGMGTTVGVVGAYILAGELAKQPNDVAMAFKSYEERMRKFVDIAQKLAPGAPSLANPDTAWGIKILYTFLGFVAWTGILGWFGASFNPPATAIELPGYQFESKPSA
ncbi:FAD-dependent monooxygenase asL4 [Fulvia fulva]|uniref:FAD-dependent monooxygenase asL4 n=1 Tax=Passalora fulva TaxID=5499 RepID=A0A9Q8LGZ0_PASFU|nr:FAD-dependent monooxygenase asL4 [Fulvia fulva]KAK4626339.1 FAD-dependent monooxygenase asL4 [Fulvia fulva]UJO16989.1 FAD-dependent monooxygenase asL4 [Fulvia fulva]WPV13707.1 FAD-dependent monooxygenase asL4 [Fulvia fulva]WPV28562.1 FAD-dependent monooxygenase asL4 [Fulvia fulva]